MKLELETFAAFRSKHGGKHLKFQVSLSEFNSHGTGGVRPSV